MYLSTSDAGPNGSLPDPVPSDLSFCSDIWKYSLVSVLRVMVGLQKPAPVLRELILCVYRQAMND